MNYSPANVGEAVPDRQTVSYSDSFCRKTKGLWKLSRMVDLATRACLFLLVLPTTPPPLWHRQINIIGQLPAESY